MPDFISREAALKNAFEMTELRSGKLMKVVDVDDLESIPAADVVQVVRCKNCRYWTGEQASPGYQQRKCERLHIPTFSQFCCAYAYARMDAKEDAHGDQA